MNRVESRFRTVDLSVLGKHLGKVPTGIELVWEILCRTHGPDSTTAVLPHNIRAAPEKLRDWVDANINPPKCSVLCHKYLGEVSRLYILDSESRRVRKKPDSDLEVVE